MTRVSADTISQLTADPAYHGGDAPLTVPHTDDMIADLRLRLSGANLAKFEELLADMPAGFRLAPVYFTCPTPDRVNARRNKKVEDEYNFRVRGAFFNHLATEHAHELRRLGISETGIRRMKKRLEPMDDEGNYYLLSVDHIVERSYGGNWAMEQQMDPDRKKSITPKFSVNHFGNLILLPDHIHDVKNFMNNIQKAGRAVQGHPQWILTLVPERNAEYSGFVAPPQRENHPLAGVLRRPNTLKAKMAQTDYVLKQAVNMLETFEYTDAAKKYRQRIGSQDNEKKSARKLTRIFNHFVKRGTPLRDDVDHVIRPMMAEVQRCVDDMIVVTDDSLPKRKASAYCNFISFFNKELMKKFRCAAERFPVREARATVERFKEIDSVIPEWQDLYDNHRRERRRFNSKYNSENNNGDAGGMPGPSSV